jgi:hypothetical protein
MHGANDDSGRGIIIGSRGAYILEPSLITSLEAFKHLWLEAGDILLLAGIILEVVEFKIGFPIKALTPETTGVDKFPVIFMYRKMMIEPGNIAAMGLKNNLPGRPS